MTASDNGLEPAHVASIPGRSMLILYGSETGNSQDIAEELGRNAQRLHFNTKVDEMNGAQLSLLLQYTLVVFVISTTGQGDMPRNSTVFWKSLLRKKLPPGCLGNVKFTTFGLGDSMYIKFNWAARKLHKRLEQLGAQEFYPRGEADEQDSDGADERYMPWAADLRKKLLDLYPLPAGVSPIPDDALLPPRYSISLLNLDAKSTNGHEPDPEKAIDELSQETNSLKIADTPPSTLLHIPSSQPATLTHNTRVTPSTHFQDPDDIPKELPSRCSEADRPHGLGPRGGPPPLSLPSDLPRGLFVDPTTSTTLRHLLTHNLDITSTPRRSFLKEMFYFTTDEYHRERLLEFTMREFTDEFYDYTTRPRRTILEVLEEFTSVRIPLGRVLDMFPIMRGRDFSIASVRQQQDQTTEVELLVALVKYKTILRKIRQGLCSRYLESLPTGTPLRITLNRSSASLHGSAHARRPLVAVATGTGVAPLRLFIEERLSHGSDVGSMAIFFGNRSRHADFHFKDVWEDLKSRQEKGRFAVHTAFSRDKDTPREYVQDVIRKRPAEIRSMVAGNAIFVVCGGSLKMSRAVKEAVKSCLAEDTEAYPDEEAVEAAFGKLTWWEEIW
uniref:Sulfite reductase flavoprotein alpha-component n=1 Tax=Colletotrichum fructicola (strain Nara gc5) TaxID=1213859 RepID=L2GHV6_COLFN